MVGRLRGALPLARWEANNFNPPGLSFLFCDRGITNNCPPNLTKEVVEINMVAASSYKFQKENVVIKSFKYSI